MPSKFLQKRVGNFLAEIAGAQTVSYVVFAPAAADPLTKDVEESAAYTSAPILLSAIVDHAPGRAARERLGLELEFEATVRLVVSQCEAAGLTPKIRDAIDLPPDGRRMYIKQIIHDKQAGSVYLEYLIAVSAKVGRRG